MDTFEFLSKGNKVPNPNYNPKTKEGRKQPQYVNGYDIGKDDIGDVAEALSIGISDASFNVNNPQNRQLLKHNIPIGKENDEDDINRLKSESQGWLEQLGKGVAQVIVNEAALGTIKGFTDLFDAAVNAGKIIKGEENDYTNDASLALERAQEYLRNKLEIYKRNPDKAFDFSDFGSIANGLVSLGSSFALLMPATGIAGGLSKLGKATKLNKATKILFNGIGNKNINLSRIKAANEFNNFMKVGTTAFISRTAENYMEARQSYKEVYDKVMNQLASMPDDNKEFFFNTNPQYVGMNDEDIAKDIASKQSTEVFKDDYAMLLMDVLEYNSINKIFNSRFRNNLKPSLRVASKEQQLLISDAAKAQEYANKKSISKWIEQAVHHPEDIAKAIVTGVPFNEAIEEGYQGYKQQRINDLTDLMLDKNANPKFIESYLTDPQILEQAFYGVVCGALFQGILGGTNTVKNKIEDAKNMSKMTPEGKNLYKLTRKSAKDEIRDWVLKLNDLNQNIIDVDKGFAPITDNDAYLTDSNGERIIDDAGMPIRRQLTEEERTERKSKLINEYIADLAIKATDKGYYNLFKEFIDNPDIVKYMKEKGVDETSIEGINKDFLSNKLDYVHTLYTDALDLFYNNVPDIDEHSSYGVILAAKQYTADKLAIEDSNVKLDNINEQLNLQNDYRNIDEYYTDAIKIKQVKAELKHQYEKQAEYAKALNDGNISKSAYNKYIEDSNKLINHFNEDLKSYKDKYENAKKINELIEQGKEFEEIQPILNDLIKEGIEKGNDVTYTTDKLLREKAREEVKSEYLQYNLPTGEEELYNYYKQFAVGIDNFIERKAQRAIDTVKNYIKGRNNLDNIFNELVTENLVGVNEKQEQDIKDALDIVKIGYSGTREYYKDIMKAIDNEKKDRLSKEKEVENTIIDGKKVEPPVEENNQPQPTPTPVITRNIAEEDADKYHANEKEDEREPNDAEIEYIEAQSADLEKLDNPEPNKHEVFYVPAPLTEEQKDRYGIIRDAEDLLLRAGNNEIKGLLKHIKTFDNTDENYREALRLFKENCGVTDLNEKEYDTLFKNALYKLYSLFHKRINSKSLPEIYKKEYKAFVDRFKNVKINANYFNEESSYIIGDRKSSTYDIIDNNTLEFVQNTISDFADYAKIKDGKISIIELFNYIRDNKGINYEQAKSIFNVLQQIVDSKGINIYINNNKLEENDENASLVNKVNFIDKGFFKKYNTDIVKFYDKLAEIKSIDEQVAESLHTSNTNSSLSTIDRSKILQYLRSNPDSLVIKRASENALGIGINTNKGFVELSYLATVSYDNTKGSYKSNANSGLLFEVWFDGSEFQSNLDDIFTNLIYAGGYLYDKDSVDKENVKQEYIGIFNALSKITKTVDEDGKRVLNTDDLKTEEDFKALLNLFRKFGDNFKFSLYSGYSQDVSDNLTNSDKEKLIGFAKKVYDILFFKQFNGFDYVNAFNYYAEWLNRIHNNYEQTYNIQNSLNKNNIELQASAKNIGFETLNYLTNTNVDVNVPNRTQFTKDDSKGNRLHYIISFEDNNGNYVSELDTPVLESIKHEAKFGKNDMGIVIFSRDKIPFIARFTESNPIENREIGKAVIKELEVLFNQFISGKLNYDILIGQLNKLLGDKNGSSLISYGLRFNKHKGGIAELTLGTNRVARIFNAMPVIGEDKKIIPDKTKRMIVLYGKDGKPIYYKKQRFDSYENYVNAIAKEIVSNLKFNRNYKALKKNELTKEANEYFYIGEDGKYHIMENRMKELGYDGVYDTYFDYVMKNKAFKVNIQSNEDGSFTTINKQFDDDIYIDVNKTVTPIVKEKPIINLIQSATTEKPVSVYNLLSSTDIDSKYINWLKELGFFNNNVYYDKDDKSKADARFKDNKVYITPRGLNTISKNSNNLTRLLVHENIHARFSELSETDKKRILEEINKIYEKVDTEIIKYNGVDKDINRARKWFKDNLKEQKDLFEGEIGAEEFLVESLTRPELFNALNKIKYSEEEISVEKPSLLQKIISIILQLFGFNFDNINKKSILAKEISILNVSSDNLTNFEIKENNTIVEKENNVKSPVEEEITNKPSFNDVGNLLDDNSKLIDNENDNNDIDDIDDYEDNPGPVEIDDDGFFSSTIDIEDEYTKNYTEQYVLENFEEIIDRYAKGLGIVNGLYISYQSEQGFLNLFPAEIHQSLLSIMHTGDIKVICR